MKPQKSLTLIELIISLLLMSMLLLATQAMHLTFTNMVQRSIYQSSLYQNASNALERILKDIRDANSIHVENNILTLNNTSQYYFDTDTKQLYYNPALANPQPTPILENVETFTVTGVKELSPGYYRAARIRIEAKDPQNRIDTVAFLQSLAYCRIISSKPVRLVYNETTPTAPKFFNTIQDAINAADSTYYIVQVSNARSPYAENLTINKNITLKGAFNNTDWSRHLGEPNYETEINGGGITTAVIKVNPTSSILLNILINGFTIRSGSQGIKLEMANAQAESSVNIADNSFIENYSNPVNLTGLANSFFTFSNNTISLIGSQQGVNIATNNNTININGNTINVTNGNSISAVKINASTSTADNITFQGNDFIVTGGSKVNGVDVSYTKGTFTFNNNTINTNTTTNAKGMYFTNIDNATINIFNNTFIGAATDDESIAINCNIAENKNPTITIANNNISNYNQGITSGHLTSRNNALLTISNNIVRDAYIGIWDIRIPTFVCSNNTITNCSYIGINLITRSSDLKVDIFNNTITQCSNSSIGIFTGSGTSANTIIRNNQCIGPGIILGPFGFLDNLKIRNNFLLGSSDIGGVNTSSVSGKITCSNNIISGHNNYGIYIYRKLPTPALSFSSTNDTITNNVCFGIIANSQVFSSFKVLNSILYGNQPVGIQETDSTFTSKSVTYSDTTCSGSIDCSPTSPPPVPPMYNIDADPQFVDPLNDFRLRLEPPPQSPCINTGDPSILDPDGSRSDMGAYGGPGSDKPIGTYTLPDDPDPEHPTPYIREDIIGTYLN